MIRAVRKRCAVVHLKAQAKQRNEIAPESVAATSSVSLVRGKYSSDVALSRAAELLASKTLKRAILSGSAPPALMPPASYMSSECSGVTKLELMPKQLPKQGLKLQMVKTLKQSRKTHAVNFEYGDGSAARAAKDVCFNSGFGMFRIEDASDMSVTQIRFTRKGIAQVNVSRLQDTRPLVKTEAHDRQKERVLAVEQSCVLRELGITDSCGRIKQSMRSKHIQVEEFVRLLFDGIRAVRGIASKQELNIVDLGCGSAYLTLAAREALAERCACVIGIDSSGERQKANTTAAQKLGFSNVHFETSDILNARVEDRCAPIDVVVALHACDTATDEALSRAVQAQAPLIVAAPCCQHHLNKQLRSVTSHSTSITSLLRHGHLRESFGDTLTDAIRSEILRLLGYRVTVVEWVASEHTPKNQVIRAEYTGACAGSTRWHELDSCLLTFGGLHPKLAELLGPALQQQMPRSLHGGALDNAVKLAR